MIVVGTRDRVCGILPRTTRLLKSYLIGQNVYDLMGEDWYLSFITHMLYGTKCTRTVLGSQGRVSYQGEKVGWRFKPRPSTGRGHIPNPKCKLDIWRFIGLKGAE